MQLFVCIVCLLKVEADTFERGKEDGGCCSDINLRYWEQQQVESLLHSLAWKTTSVPTGSTEVVASCHFIPVYKSAGRPKAFVSGLVYGDCFRCKSRGRISVFSTDSSCLAIGDRYVIWLLHFKDDVLSIHSNMSRLVPTQLPLFCPWSHESSIVVPRSALGAYSIF